MPRTYTSRNRPTLLAQGDSVEFHIINRPEWTGENPIRYVVNNCYLNNRVDENYAIFTALGIEDKEAFCARYYGYAPEEDGSWPQTSPHDLAALTRCVIALFDVQEGMDPDVIIHPLEDGAMVDPGDQIQMGLKRILLQVQLLPVVPTPEEVLADLKRENILGFDLEGVRSILATMIVEGKLDKNFITYLTAVRVGEEVEVFADPPSDLFLQILKFLRAQPHRTALVDIYEHFKDYESPSILAVIRKLAAAKLVGSSDGIFTNGSKRQIIDSMMATWDMSRRREFSV